MLNVSSVTCVSTLHRFTDVQHHVLVRLLPRHLPESRPWASFTDVFRACLSTSCVLVFYVCVVCLLEPCAAVSTLSGSFSLYRPGHALNPSPQNVPDFASGDHCISPSKITKTFFKRYHVLSIARAVTRWTVHSQLVSMPHAPAFNLKPPARNLEDF